MRGSQHRSRSVWDQQKVAVSQFAGIRNRQSGSNNFDMDKARCLRISWGHRCSALHPIGSTRMISRNGKVNLTVT